MSDVLAHKSIVALLKAMAEGARLSTAPTAICPLVHTAIRTAALARKFSRVARKFSSPLALRFSSKPVHTRQPPLQQHVALLLAALAVVAALVALLVAEAAVLAAEEVAAVVADVNPLLSHTIFITIKSFQIHII